MLRALGLFLVLLAVLSSGLWLGYWRPEGDVSDEMPLSLALLTLTATTTCVNLFLRWLRWHFLLRRFGVRLATRASFSVYFSTLPAILTPFYLGEIVRSLVCFWRQKRLRPLSVKIWLIERGGDVAILLIACLPGLVSPWLVVPSLLLCMGMMAWVLDRIERTPAADAAQSALPLAAFLMTTAAVSWLLPILSLWSMLNLLASQISVADTAFAFSASSLLGALSGIPGGIAISGSTEILLLDRVMDSPQIAWCVAIFRLGTIWFSVGLGTLVLWFFRHRILSMVRGEIENQQHFDGLAAQYSDQIAEHTRDKLLQRKVAYMHQRLGGDRSRAENGAPLRGLDIGCGQGWYMTAMGRLGYRMSGIDASAGQVAQALAFAKDQGVELACEVASAITLPFDDNTFDFAYSINVLHHVLDDQARAACYAEIVRVVKPGGVFFLQEMNTENPLFRLYMSYLFPLLNRIDEGDERWILPSKLPPVKGAHWDAETMYFTFLPDFLPAFLSNWLGPIESFLENSKRLRRYSAHYVALLRRDPATAANHDGEISNNNAGDAS